MRSNTLEHVWKENGGLNIPNMIKLGLGNISGLDSIDKCESPAGNFGKLAEMSNGKDTTIGHWEMTGIYSPSKFPTYPNGFPEDVIDEFIKKTGVPGGIGKLYGIGNRDYKETRRRTYKNKETYSVYICGQCISDCLP